MPAASTLVRKKGGRVEHSLNLFYPVLEFRQLAPQSSYEPDQLVNVQFEHAPFKELHFVRRCA